MFYSETNKPKRQPQPKMSKFQDVYEEFIDKNGKKYLKKVDTINVYEKIQEARASTDLQELINKYNLKINNNDLTKLEELATIYLTEIPDNLLDAQNQILAAENIYKQSPREIKEKFNNNFNEFLQGAYNGTLKSYLEERKPKTTEETMDNRTASEQTMQQTIVTQNQTTTEQKGVNLNV